MTETTDLPQHELIKHIAEMFAHQTTVLEEMIDEKIEEKLEQKFNEFRAEIKIEFAAVRSDIRRMDRLLDSHGSDIYSLKTLHPNMSHGK